MVRQAASWLGLSVAALALMAGDRGQTILEAARTALAAGDYPHAIQRSREAAALFRESKDIRNEAWAVNVAGLAELYQGEYDAALTHFREALGLDRKTADGDGESTRLGNIGNVYFFQGRYLDAQESYEAALRRAEEKSAQAWSARRRQLALTNLATLYEQLGQNPRALDYYRQALAVGNGAQPAERGQLLSNLGTLYRRMGDAVKALETYDAADQLFNQGHMSAAEIHVLQNAGIALALDLRDNTRAEARFTRALELAQATRNRREIVLAHLFRGESLFRSGRAEEAHADFEAALSAAREIGAVEEQWTALYGMARTARQQGDTAAASARLQEAIALIESVRAGLGRSSLKSDFLADKRDVYDAAVGLLLDAPQRDMAQLFHLFEQARSRNLRDTIRGVSSAPVLDAVQKRLPKGSALVEYWIGDGRMAALWLTRNGSGVSSQPWSTADDTAVRELASALKSGREDNWRGAAARIAAPLLAGMPREAIRQVMVIPDGVLYLLPFEAMPLDVDGGLLIERMPVSYLPSAALLLRKDAARSMLPPWRRQLVAFGDPIMDPRSALPEDERWQRLPEAGRELLSIRRALPGRAAIYAGQDNRKQRLSAATVSGVPVLHFTTHAAVDATDPNRSRMLFTPEPGNRGSEYLFRGEVPSLPLENTDLVTLSACDTEVGKLSRGEGIQSFSRAFLAAGARATVTTLWRVEDRTTADFMQVFYRDLGSGARKAEALQTAKLAFLRAGGRRAMPQSWAAFVLTGEGDSPIRPVSSWLLLFGPLGLVALAVFAFFRLRHG